MVKMKKITVSLFVLVLALAVVGTTSMCTATTYPAPELQSPQNGSIVTIDSITLSWNAVSEANYYMLVKSSNQVDWANFSTSQPSSIYATSWTLSEDDLYDHVYSFDKQDTFYWKVTAVCGDYLTFSPDSSIWSFSVLKVPIAFIDVDYWNGRTDADPATYAWGEVAFWELINSMASGPLGGWGSPDLQYWGSSYIAVTTLNSVPLIWSDRNDDSQQTPVAFADFYRVQISDSSAFDNLIVNTTTENTSYTTPELSSDTYYWRVRSETNDELVTDWNTPRRFYIASGGVVTTDNDSDGMPNSWETQYGLNPNYSSDASQDMDGDGYTNLQEYQAGTDPTSASSHPEVVQPVVLPAAVTVTNISEKLGKITVGENGVASVTVSSPKMVQVNFENEQPVDSLTIYTDENMDTVSVGVEQLSQKPAAVPEPTASLPGIIVSHYMDITVTPTAAAPVQVENNSTIVFRVSKSWLSNNNISPAGVLLLRYSNGQWSEQFAMPLEKEDATYKYYTALVPGFSTFAVAGEAATPSGTAAPSDSTMLIIAGAVILIVVIAVAVFFTKFK
jgi:PGF-pre-PGF domain-containing protein